MPLPKEELDQFYKLHKSLLLYTNKKFRVLKGLDNIMDFQKFPIKKVMEVREKLCKNLDLIDSFVAENPYNFSQEELEIIKGWKNPLKGSFVILKQQKDYALFLTVGEDPPKVYGVYHLMDSFEEVVGHLPAMVEAVLLPFKNKIVYDGFLYSYNLYFGRGIKQSLMDAYEEAKLRFGVITSLSSKCEKKEVSDEEKLRFYLKSERNREIYAEEIFELIEKDRKLLVIYHQEMSKYYAKRIRKRLKELGITAGWFAVLEDIVIATGSTKEEVEEVLKKILPAEKRELVGLFKIQGA